ncbi:uncharacterized protein LOC134842681 [Symsagittifera roscoffensis]|uniref:uncharacterized protein LOC134842681 n=1 Tax=Symsagittifera roscoffensis TaxID=84072 RepID=UPI00307C6277
MIFHLDCCPSAALIILLSAIGTVWNEEAEPCREECTGGFERIEGLKHCYKFLLDLGPVSQDKAVTACGIERGSTLVTFDNVGDDQTIRDHFVAKFRDDIESSPAFIDASGFWTGYLRDYGSSDYPFVNMISGALMNMLMFRPGQPNNDILGKNGMEACVSRKQILNEATGKHNHTGLDDFTCAYPNWAICMHRDVFALNQVAYNTALISGLEGSQLPVDGTCQLGWEEQNKFMLLMMKDKRLKTGYSDAQFLANRYMEILNTSAIQTPVCHLVQE